MPIIGAHVSAAGGLKKAIERAEKIGAECIQIFGASPRTFWAKMPTEQDLAEYKAALKKSGIGPVFLHAAYLVNLASPKSDLRAKSVKSLSDHLKIAELLGAQGLIFHIGSGKDMPREEAMDLTVKGMKEVLTRPTLRVGGQGPVQLIMENTAGGGQKIGRDASELGWIKKHVGSARVKVCVDTAHAFEAGAITDYKPKNIKKFLDEYDLAVGFKDIVAFHVNDSKTLANSHNDRHENIGKGHIGLAGFKNLAKDKRMKNMPWILEVPGFSDEGPDRRNVEILKNICK
jgi:deoxyribonuclease-4